ncbi:hypothetical protein [uncultured Brachyspira sp.]|uniref:hypothetical protein n=1 Tax=uncultured Brachyspira sp. TaxID=221953 RepID=UPI0026089418|nr:hypothetical protein [uncultured Brachyspira sp.]
MKYKFIILILIFLGELYPQTNSFKEKMDFHSKEVKSEWKFNPLRVYETDKYLYGWLDPEVYNCKYWIGDIFSIEDMYNNGNYRFDKMSFFHQPTLATEINPIVFNYKDKHRFKIGVGFLTQFFLSVYNPDYKIFYGESLFYGTYMQVEAYFDYIYNDVLRFRFTPIRHICTHIGGDILGDNELYDRNKEEFRDSSIELMHFSLHYKYGYFTFYGGFSFAMTGFDESNFVNLFGLYYGTDFRYPLWGEISLITGFYLGASYDRINTVLRRNNTDGYNIVNSYDKWFPSISVGIGIEIYRFVIGVKYEYMRSRQLYAYRKMENKLGLEVSLFF